VKILSVKSGKRAPVLLTAVREEGSEPILLGVSEAEYASLGSPIAGDALDGAAEEALIALDARHRARSAAFRILSFGDNNRATLARKLRARGVAPALAEEVCAEMAERGYIREDDLLRREVMAAAKKLWGPRRIADALAAKGYARDAVTATVDALVAEGELDFSEVRRRLIERRGGGKDMPALRALLYRYGFGGET
jgi:SOS response regulatory protein OraA/RecX